MPKDRLVAETELAYAVRDAFPATPLHTMVIPKRHVSGYFELGRAELSACHRLLEQEKAAIERTDASMGRGSTSASTRARSQDRRSSTATCT
jgi:diadenosine tetraphosphate (Ap4A) HIT family hydrolase